MSLPKNIPYKFILLAVLLLVADFTIENINHKFQLNDFKVYYGAAQALVSGKQVYGALFSLGSGYYKYSPFTALLFYPFSALPYSVACIIDFILISVSILYISILLLKIFSQYFFTAPVKYPNLILSLSLLCISTHLVRELELGNVNVILLLLLCVSLSLLLRNKMVLAGVFLALVVITKPFFILVFIPLLMRRYFKTIFTSVLLCLLFLALPALVVGIGNDITLHKEWLNAMLLHADAFPSPNTIEALIRNNFASPLTSNLQYIVLVLLLIPYMLFICRNCIKNGADQYENARNLIVEWFTLLAIIPSVFKTDSEHFLMTFPLILFILIYLFNKRNTLLTVLFIVLIILYAGNSSDILGKELSLKIYNNGILGISNLLLTTMGLYVFYVNRKNEVVVER